MAYQFQTQDIAGNFTNHSVPAAATISDLDRVFEISGKYDLNLVMSKIRLDVADMLDGADLNVNTGMADENSAWTNAALRVLFGSETGNGLRSPDVNPETEAASGAPTYGDVVAATHEEGHAMDLSDALTRAVAFVAFSDTGNVTGSGMPEDPSEISDLAKVDERAIKADLDLYESAGDSTLLGNLNSSVLQHILQRAWQQTHMLEEANERYFEFGGSDMEKAEYPDDPDTDVAAYDAEDIKARIALKEDDAIMFCLNLTVTTVDTHTADADGASVKVTAGSRSKKIGIRVFQAANDSYDPRDSDAESSASYQAEAYANRA